MRDEPARDAVKRGLLDTFRGAWTDSEYEATFGPAADAVLAALGIPPTTTTDTICAGLLRIEHPGWSVFRNDSGGWTAVEPVDRRPFAIATGASPAAAVNALAARMESPDA